MSPVSSSGPGGAAGLLRSKGLKIRAADPETTFDMSPRRMLKQRIEAEKITKLTQIDMKTLKGLFDGIQTEADDSPALNKRKFVELMMRSGCPAFRDQSVAASFFEALDLNGNGHVDKKELLLALITLANGSLEEKLRTCFRVYDLNKDRVIQREELALVLRALTSERLLGKPIAVVVNEIFEKFDTDKNDGIDMDEFIIAARERPDLQRLFVLDVPVFQGSSSVGAAATGSSGLGGGSSSMSSSIKFPSSSFQ